MCIALDTDYGKHGSMFVSILSTYLKAGTVVMRIFRWDLQLHFFWGFVLTLLGIFWPLLYGAGFAVTIIKESLDLWSKGHWSWGDFWWGCIGSGAAVLFLYIQGAVLAS